MAKKLMVAVEAIEEREREAAAAALIDENTLKDFDEAKELAEIGQEQTVVSEALDAIDSLEAYTEILEKTLESGGASKDLLLMSNVALEHVNKRFNLGNGASAALESFDKSGATHATTIAVEGMRASMEGLLGDIINKIKAFFGKIGNFLVGVKQELTAANEKLNKISKDYTPSDSKIQFEKAGKYNINGKFDPLQVLNNVDNIYNAEIKNGDWANPIIGSANAAIKIMEKYRSDKMAKPDHSVDAEELIKNIEAAVSAEVKLTTGNSWKASKTKDGKPTLEASISDAIKVVRGAPSMKFGLAPSGFNWSVDNYVKANVKPAEYAFVKQLNTSLKGAIDSTNTAKGSLAVIESNMNNVFKKLSDVTDIKDKYSLARTLVVGLISVAVVYVGIYNIAGALTTSAVTGLTGSGAAAGAPSMALGVISYIGGLIGFNANIIKSKMDKKHDEINKDEDAVLNISTVKEKLKADEARLMDKVASSISSVMSNFVNPYHNLLIELVGYVEKSVAGNED